MREFSDGSGRRWDVVAGRESWGAFFAIFVPRSGGGDDPGIRQVALEASGHDEAAGELASLSDDELRELLDRSSPKDPG